MVSRSIFVDTTIYADGHESTLGDLDPDERASLAWCLRAAALDLDPVPADADADVIDAEVVPERTPLRKAARVLACSVAIGASVGNAALWVRELLRDSP